MDKKIYAVIVVVIVIIVAAAAVVVLTNNDGDGKNMDMTVVAQVNTQGSGMFAAEGLDLASTSEDGEVTFNDANWDQIVVLTPGPSSIQHVQLQQLVTQELEYQPGVNYEFTQYNVTTVKQPGHVYWVQMSSSGMVADFTQNQIYDAGFIWEPVYTQALMNQERAAEPVFLTNDLWPEHACCVVAANTDYVSGHGDEVTAFLAGYRDAVDFLNAAKADKPDVMPTIEKTMTQEEVLAMGDYEYIVWLGMNRCNMDQEVVERALDNVTYTYSSSGNNLDTLRGEVVDLVNDFVAMGASVVNKPVSATGYDTVEEFVDNFVNDSYLEASADFSGNVNASMTVAVISGDIHQLALHIAEDLGMFDQYGLNVVVNQAANGAGVANLLLGGEANVGFLGAPPAAINTINFA